MALIRSPPDSHLAWEFEHNSAMVKAGRDPDKGLKTTYVMTTHTPSSAHCAVCITVCLQNVFAMVLSGLRG